MSKYSGLLSIAEDYIITYYNVNMHVSPYPTFCQTQHSVEHITWVTDDGIANVLFGSIQKRMVTVAINVSFYPSKRCYDDPHNRISYRSLVCSVGKREKGNN